jgi:hypothetical protein
MNVMETLNLSYQTADDLLENAREELNRPKEDLVPYAICQKAYDASKAYMLGFLQEKDVNVDRKMNPQELMEACQKVNAAFDAVDISIMHNPMRNEEVWTSEALAHNFVDLAEKIRLLTAAH